MENFDAGGAAYGEEIGKLFGEFCQAKGIEAKFKAECGQFFENSRGQYGQDGMANCRIEIEDIKKEAADSDYAKKIAAIKAETRNVNAGYGAVTTLSELATEKLSADFNAFLKEKGLAGKYSVQIFEI